MKAKNEKCQYPNVIIGHKDDAYLIHASELSEVEVTTDAAVNLVYIHFPPTENHAMSPKTSVRIRGKVKILFSGDAIVRYRVVG